MKLFKLIKSIDYVSYPSYKELVKISDAVSNSITTFRDMLISTVAGVLFEKTPLSECILTCLANKFPGGTIENIAKYENSAILLSIIIAVTIFGLLKLAHFIKARWGSNKNTKKKRDILVHEFYNVSIPQLIEVKSIIEQMKDDESEEEQKIALLLLQAKYEICDLYRSIFNMNIIENEKNGLQTDDSYTLSSRIGKCAYINFLKEMLDIMCVIFTELSENYSDMAKDDIEDIRSIINSSGVFSKVNELESKLQEIRKKITPKSENAL